MDIIQHQCTFKNSTGRVIDTMKGKMRTLKRSRKSREEILLNNEKFKISRKERTKGQDLKRLPLRRDMVV